MRWFPSPCLADDGEGGGGGGATSSASGTTPVTIKVRYGDGEVEVERPAGLLSTAEIEQRYVLKAAHNDQMARMRKEIDARKDHRAPEDLLNDETFRAKAIESWGLSPNQTQQQLQESIKKARDEVVERQVKPLETRVGALTDTIRKSRERSLRSEIISAAAMVKVASELMKPPTKGGTPPIVSMLRDSFGYDEERDAWFAKTADGSFAFSQSDTEQPYMGVLEFLNNWLEGDGKLFRKVERQTGAESSPTQHTVESQGRTLRLTEAQIRDIPFYKQMLAKAAREGLTIERVPG